MSEDQEKVIEERRLASILKAQLTEQNQDNLLNSNVKNIFIQSFLTFQKQKKLKQDIKNSFTEKNYHNKESTRLNQQRQF